MSLPRIFELARKLGTPVIMTDPAGREPLVVLSLDQFEAMAGVSGDAESATPEIHKKVQNKAKEMSSIPPSPELTPAPPLPEDMALEERFYLEPLEGETGFQG